MPRPSFKPTPEQRQMVESMSGYGVPEAAIAESLKIDAKTLRKHFRTELDSGALKAHTAVARSAYKLATSGQCPAMTMFWLKCRAGWRETTVLQHTGADGGAVEISHVELEKRITDELARLATGGSAKGLPPSLEIVGEKASAVPVAGMAGPSESGGPKR